MVEIIMNNMDIINFCISNNQIYAIRVFGKFIDFRQWYYLYCNGVKNDSWWSVEELKYAIKNESEKDIWFEPIPKRISMFKNKD
jgi:hypothetical protein